MSQEQYFSGKNDSQIPTVRKTFGKIKESVIIPNLIDMQLSSFLSFLLGDVKRKESIQPEIFNTELPGIDRLFQSIFPIESQSGDIKHVYLNSMLKKPKYSIDECLRRGKTYFAPLHATFQLIISDKDEETGIKEISNIKEQTVYICDIPLMTDAGTFIVNGTERIVVSQLHRSPCVFFEHDKGKLSGTDKLIYSARIIPYRGSWIDFLFDAKDILHCRIDRKKKIYATTLLKALGYSEKDILKEFYQILNVKKHKFGWITEFDYNSLIGSTISFDIRDPEDNSVIIKAETRFLKTHLKKLEKKNKHKYLLLHNDDLLGRYVASQVKKSEKSKPILNVADIITPDKLKELQKIKESEFTIQILNLFGFSKQKAIIETLIVEKNDKKTISVSNPDTTQEIQEKQKALSLIYSSINMGGSPVLEMLEGMFEKLFFNPTTYELSKVGRTKMNARLGLDIDENVTILTKKDIIVVLKKLVEIHDEGSGSDDIDHLSNRRVRSVGELITNQFKIGLARLQRLINDRMVNLNLETAMPQDFINPKIINTIINDFFAVSQLSQFMDQTNPLAEITHKRRLSALGPGGLSRDRAGFDVRDVHYTHYGRVCPVETPEGANIGLINSIAVYAKINEHGFIQTPYFKVENGKVSQESYYLTAEQERDCIIAQATEELDQNNMFKSELIACRKNDDFIMSSPSQIDYIDVSPKQLVSVATSLIPFLENDDANRALMGSNMQRQAVPLLFAESPLVGTGMEEAVVRNSSTCVVAKTDGEVIFVDAKVIIVKNIEDRLEVYNIKRYSRSNQNTMVDYNPIVHIGDKVNKGKIIADGVSVKNGELSLGKNILVGFMSWNGYNFEDSILVSERLLHDDTFTSYHIEKFEVVARDTRLGAEEIVRDIPGTSEYQLRHLDEGGVCYVGAEVKGEDILVGKVTPKSGVPNTPEERLLKAIFAEKTPEVKNNSLKMPVGMTGTVVAVDILTRRGMDKSSRAVVIEKERIAEITKEKNRYISILENYVKKEIQELVLDKEVLAKKIGKFNPKNKVTQEIIDELETNKLVNIITENDTVNQKIKNIAEIYLDTKTKYQTEFDDKLQLIGQGDDLPQGVLQIIKVFVLFKKRLQPGDKMAGRHGNKGVVSNILPIRDMPYLEDGTPLDMILNPLGVPSRMNIGQVMETHLGLVSVLLGKQIEKVVQKYQNEQTSLDEIKQLLLEIYDDSDEIKQLEGKQIVEFAKSVTKGVSLATPIFDGAREQEISDFFKKAGIKETGQVTVYDGITGEPLDRNVTIGYIYMLKLHHMVDDKMHARSTGPYSLVTQQPLGGKSYNGGQRFGEMEVWALQAYGAAFTLQEMLTVKSDDINGRVDLYDSIVKGDNSFNYGIPQSFNVMMMEIKSLCLNVELE